MLFPDGSFFASSGYGSKAAGFTGQANFSRLCDAASADRAVPGDIYLGGTLAVSDSRSATDRDGTVTYCLYSPYGPTSAVIPLIGSQPIIPLLTATSSDLTNNIATTNGFKSVSGSSPCDYSVQDLYPRIFDGRRDSIGEAFKGEHSVSDAIPAVASGSYFTFGLHLSVVPEVRARLGAVAGSTITSRSASLVLSNTLSGCVNLALRTTSGSSTQSARIRVVAITEFQGFVIGRIDALVNDSLTHLTMNYSVDPLGEYQVVSNGTFQSIAGQPIQRIEVSINSATYVIEAGTVSVSAESLGTGPVKVIRTSSIERNSITFIATDYILGRVDAAHSVTHHAQEFLIPEDLFGGTVGGVVSR